MAYKHGGMREFNGEELGASSLGQCGFKMICPSGSDVEIECGVTAGYENIKFFSSIKAVEEDAEVKCRSLIGDDFSTTGVYSGAVVTILESDIIHGTFDKITVTDGDKVIAYIGR